MPTSISTGRGPWSRPSRRPSTARRRRSPKPQSPSTRNSPRETILPPSSRIRTPPKRRNRENFGGSPIPRRKGKGKANPPVGSVGAEGGLEEETRRRTSAGKDTTVRRPPTPPPLPPRSSDIIPIPGIRGMHTPRRRGRTPTLTPIGLGRRSSSSSRIPSGRTPSGSTGSTTRRWRRRRGCRKRSFKGIRPRGRRQRGWRWGWARCPAPTPREGR
mmetsp:Transcript_21305/g.62002  ORF Transcript_21305/g.62002 Transcript_21305/m.62002 type:complete len:215 (+) Transcript_21305:358-1002(+)